MPGAGGQDVKGFADVPGDVTGFAYVPRRREVSRLRRGFRLR